VRGLGFFERLLEGSEGGGLSDDTDLCDVSREIIFLERILVNLMEVNRRGGILDRRAGLLSLTVASLILEKVSPYGLLEQ